MISELISEEKGELEAFLVFVFGEAYRSLARQHIAEMFSSSLSRPLFLICRQGNEIISSAALSEALFTVHTWGIGWVGVHPDKRRQGLGVEIVGAALDAIASRIKSPATAILSAYPDGVHFYGRLGFTGQTTDHEGNPFLSRKVYPKAL